MADEGGPASVRTRRARGLRSAGLATVLLLASGSVSSPQGAAGQETVTEIVVANNSDAINGDTSTVEALIADPGDDGISLREAIEATNNDPGSYTIRFDGALASTTVTLDASLPQLLGGNVTIDGDVDGDGDPDLTLTTEAVAGSALQMSSSGNRLHALRLRGFDYGVAIGPPHDPFPSPGQRDNRASPRRHQPPGRYGRRWTPQPRCSYRRQRHPHLPPRGGGVGNHRGREDLSGEVRDRESDLGTADHGEQHQDRDGHWIR